VKRVTIYQFMLQKRMIDAVFKTMIISASIHIVILLLHFLSKRDVSILNVFNIYDLDLFFPTIAVGVQNFILSIIFLILLYLSILIFFTKHIERQ